MDDTLIYMLQRACSYFGSTSCFVKITFFDLSGAFNTIQPATEREATGNGSKHIHHLVDYRVPDRQAIVCEAVLCLTW